MKIWLTLPYDKNGIEEAEVTDASTDACLQFLGNKSGQWSYNWYREGYSWHRTKAAAIKMARRHRENWVAETTAKAAEIASLPSIAA